MLKNRIRKAIIRTMKVNANYYIMQYHTSKLIVPRSLCDFLINQPFEPETIDHLKRNVRSGDIIIDVGANVGFYTVPFSPLVGPHGKIIAFEPDPCMNRLLDENIRLNDLSNVEIYKEAVSNTTGIKQFFITYPGGSSLLPVRGVREIINVPTITIDSLELDRVDWIKIDTEGTEADVLKGAKETIERCKPNLIVEFIPSNGPVDDLLKELEGWNLKGIDHNLLCWKAIS